MNSIEALESIIETLKMQKEKFRDLLKFEIGKIKGGLSSFQSRLDKRDNFSGVDKISDAIADIDAALTALESIRGDLKNAITNIENRIEKINNTIAMLRAAEKAKEKDESADEEDKGDK